MSAKVDPLVAAEKGESEEGVEKPRDSLPPATRNTNMWVALGAVLLVGALVLAITLPIVLVKDSSSTSVDAAKGSSAGQQTQGAQASNRVVVANGPFNASFSVFGPEMTKGYKSSKDFEEDLRNAAYLVINRVVEQNRAYQSVNGSDDSPGDDSQNSAGFADSPEAPGASANLASKTSEAGDSYGTNNQEEGVEEGDQIVSDGDYVYAAYGDYIVVWGARDGKMVATIQMPAIELPETNTTSQPVTTDTADAAQGFTSEANDTATDVPVGKVAPNPFVYQPKPYVQSLLLDGQRLLAIVSGYGATYMNWYMPVTDGDTHVLYSYLATRVFVYDTTSLASGELPLLVSSYDINGDYIGVRAVDGNAHIVTSSGIDTYTYLQAPLELSQLGNERLTNEEYTAEVTRIATETSVPNFVEKLQADLAAGGVSLNVLRISLFASTGAQESFSGGKAMLIAQGGDVFNTYTQVTSLNMHGDSQGTELAATGVFLPSWGAQVYGSLDTLILASQAWDYDLVDGKTTQTTYLIGLSLSGASSIAHSAGQTPGYVMNSYSIDVVGNILRLATTIQDMQIMFFSEPMMKDAAAATAFDAPMAGGMGGTESESRTENYVIMLELPGLNGTEPGAIQELGRIQLGKPNETFTAVRFFDDVAYAVTFERKDPLYVLDVSDAANPHILGELEISGFSSYLHPINDGTALLAVGDETDVNGTITGLQITVFDVVDPANPVAVQRHVFENNPDSYSYSDVEWDYHAFRYANGQVIIPVDIYNWQDETQNFNGNYVFTVNENAIQEDCRISQQPQSTLTTCYCAWLPRRSMVFGSNVMTTGGNTVLSTSLDTCESVWSLDVVIDDPSGSCCNIMY